MSVPKLRFKDDDGRDFPDWGVYELKDIANINPRSSKLPDTFIYIDLESVKNGRLLFENRIELKTAPSRAQRLLQKNDILYQTVRPYQKNNLLFNQDGDYVASTGYAQIRTKQNTNFIFQLLYTEYFINEVLSRCTGTSYPAIDSTSLSEIQINIPKIKEQTKIADFLMTVDEKIAQLTQKCELLARYKKGVMQQLFSQELRFKDDDGRDFPDWDYI
ncbi:MAG: restriction endonuclease subunit S, partial [Aphanizomenon gracile PMC638.10]|nr:restriction endonuclease subunit S [Aphanizomenon gracile PMC638.10]